MPFLALIVTLLAIGASVLAGVLGYLIEKNADRAESHPERNG
jgi:hypothetical protein